MEHQCVFGSDITIIELFYLLVGERADDRCHIIAAERQIFHPAAEAEIERVLIHKEIRSVKPLLQKPLVHSVTPQQLQIEQHYTGVKIAGFVSGFYPAQLGRG